MNTDLILSKVQILNYKDIIKENLMSVREILKNT